MQIPDFSPSVTTSRSAEEPKPASPRRGGAGEVPEVMSTGAVAASGAPEILDVEATADSPDASEISVLAQTIVAKPDESAGVEALARAYESGSYRLTPEVLARSLVNYYLESGLPDVRAKKPSGS